MATVCDGMGGMTDGGKASETAVMLQKERFEVIKDNPETAGYIFFMEEREPLEYHDEDEGGGTLASLFAGIKLDD